MLKYAICLAIGERAPGPARPAPATPKAGVREAEIVIRLARRVRDAEMCDAADNSKKCGAGPGAGLDRVRWLRGGGGRSAASVRLIVEYGRVL
jgi:hypothetical protein